MFTDMHCSVFSIIPFLLQMLLLMQTDVTARVEIEVRMTALNETQINFLDQVRWILGVDRLRVHVSSTRNGLWIGLTHWVFYILTV